MNCFKEFRDNLTMNEERKTRSLREKAPTKIRTIRPGFDPRGPIHLYRMQYNNETSNAELIVALKVEISGAKYILYHNEFYDAQTAEKVYKDLARECTEE